ncbi:MAG TPA: sigma-70 family RNA polymerase sigma factor [Ktedonobacteraceae bacterium]|nr:sigma-70 family RNA polymerase sigma factor [Ktedonobacteraceae bacterium]
MIDEFLENAKNGEHEALSEIYRHFFPKIFHFILKRVGFHETAEDLTSEVFIQMLKHIRLFKSENAMAFHKWLYQIARAVIAEHYRKRKDILSLEQNDESIFDEIAQHEAWLDLVQGINKLQDSHRQLIIDRFILGYNQATIARLTGKKEGTIRVTEYRATQNLRKLIR